MSALKIVFLDGDKQIVLYGQGMTELWHVESHLLERIDSKIRVRPETVRFRKFWIDEEGDHVEIMNEVDFQFFLKGGGLNKTPKIYFEHQNQHKNQTEQLQPSTFSSSQKCVEVPLSVHTNIGCDECNVLPILGHRYKCLQCPDFDLCMKCEGAMRHSDHIVLRIPSPEAANSEPLGSIAAFVGSKRCQRKCAKAAAVAAGNEGKSRHHRHHGRHGGNSGAGIWSNFYGMMQDLTEGGSIPMSSETTETSTKHTQQEGTQQAQANSSKAAAASTSQSKATNTSPDRTSKPTEEKNPSRSSESAPPSYENLQTFVDPRFMKTGIQILSNFSEMFEKILDPVMTADVSRSSSGPGSVVAENDLTKGQSGASTSETSTGIPKQAVASKDISADALPSVTPMETEVPEASAASSIPETLPRSLNLESVENDWTMIDDKICSSNPAAVAAKVVASSPPFDYAKLSQQVRTHIENEMKDVSPSFVAPREVPAPNIPSPQVVPETPLVAPVVAAPVLTMPGSAETPAVVAPVAAAPVLTIPDSTERRAFAPETPIIAPVPTTPETAERRAFSVYHSDARINSSVHAMMAMGFSNEGAMLTQLLESVNGSIPLALDMMSAAQHEEGDHVEIMNEVDFQFFLKGGGLNKTPKIYFEHQNQHKNQTEQLQPSTFSSSQKCVEVPLSVHTNIGCDECNVLPILGHRYKCLQCPDFDLCMKCEGAMRHSDHIVLRIPSPEAANSEPLGSIAAFVGSKRCQRKCAKAAAVAAGNEGKSRHHRHHGRHGGNSGAGIWSNFYGMMQDLTEGGSIPMSSETTETSTKHTQQEGTQQAQANSSKAAAASTSQSKATNTSPDRTSKPTEEKNPSRSSESAPPSYENLQTFVDPRFMKTGIQILSNFSEMFEKILDPVMTADVSRSSSGPGSVVAENDLTKGQSGASTSETSTGIPKQAVASKDISADALPSVTPMETEVPEASAASSIPETLPRSLNLESVENDWTMIDDKICSSNPAAVAAKVVASSPPFDYAKLSQQVRTHIENEMKDVSPSFVAPREVPAPNIPSPQVVPETPLVAPVVAAPVLTMPGSAETPAVVAPVAAAPVLTIPDSTERRAFAPETPIIAPVPTTPETAERRAFSVYHSDARINSSVHAMMAMGFSNEGAMLTQLLESVNGSIPLALDMMSAAQRN